MKALLLIIALSVGFISVSQRQPDQLFIEGTVLGYSFDPKGLFKKEKVVVQGSLSGVQLEAKNSKNKSVAKTKTNNGGEFSLYIPVGDTYTLLYSKSGYGTSALFIELDNIPGDMASTGLQLSNIELILNDNETDKPVDNGAPFGNIRYTPNKREFYFKIREFSSKEKLFKKDADNTPVNLIKGSIAKNKDNNKNAVDALPEEVIEDDKGSTDKKRIIRNTETGETIEVAVEEVAVLSKSHLTDISDWDNLSDEDLDNRAKELSSAWDQLESDKLVAVTEADFMLIQAREEALTAAENELEAARTFIEEQEEKLSAQRYFMYALIGLILFLGGFAFVLIKSIRDKKAANVELEKRNAKISASIKYAERIQQSVLLSDVQIKALLPNSFVYFQPLDVVSGDLYWFSEVGNKVVVAAIDCTGHGVPGAFMSLIGNTLMNQIVNEKNITEPGQILSQLHDGIVSALRQQDDAAAAQDGMDMSVCTIDKKSRELSYSGAMNPVYVAHKGEITELSPNLRGIGGVMMRKKKGADEFVQEKMTLDADSCVYMFSDGYMDQFGGDKNEKFNITRFKELLLNIHAKPMEDQKVEIGNAIDSWKGSSSQIDDMLVIGIKL